jgi:hypothetical protein
MILERVCMKCHHEKPLLVRLVYAGDDREELWCVGCVYKVGRWEEDRERLELLEQMTLERGGGRANTYDT